MKAKILLFLKLPPPLTGASTMNRFVAESRLIKDNFKIKLIPISYKINIEDAKVLSFQKIVTLFKLYVNLIISLKRYKPKIVYFQISPVGLAFYRDFIFALIIKLFGKHIVFHLHGKGINEYIGFSYLKRQIYSYTFRNSSVICLAESLTSDIAKVYYNKPYLVNNAIPVEHMDSNYKIQNISLIQILFLSNLIASKGIFHFLDALSLLNKSVISQTKALIVGREIEISGFEIKREIENRQLDKFVDYLGPKYNIEKNEILLTSDILIYPTFNDVWGLVILEAMQFGIPVIASREGAIPEIVDDGITGYLVDKHRPDQIAEKLEILINDPELRKKMGEAGKKKFLEKYTLETFERNMVTVFQDVIKKIDANI